MRAATILRPTARTIPWVPLLIAAAVSTVVVVVRRDAAEAGSMQLCAFLLASGAGFAFDDPAAEVLAASPTSLRRRRTDRIALVGLPTIALWGVLLGWHGTASAEESWALIALFAGALGLGLGIAGVASRRSSPSRGGVAVGPAILVLLILSTTVPPRWRPLPIGDIPGGWSQIITRWSAAALVGVLAVLISSRDRA